MLAREDESTEELLKTWQHAVDRPSRKKAPVPGAVEARAAARPPTWPGCRRADLAELIQQLTDQMHTAAAELQFEVAARLRDEISDLKKELRQMVEAGAR